jgi:hypothetical protein
MWWRTEEKAVRRVRREDVIKRLVRELVEAILFKRRDFAELPQSEGEDEERERIAAFLVAARNEVVMRVYPPHRHQRARVLCGGRLLFDRPL